MWPGSWQICEGHPYHVVCAHNHAQWTFTPVDPKSTVKFYVPQVVNSFHTKVLCKTIRAAKRIENLLLIELEQYFVSQET